LNKKYLQTAHFVSFLHGYHIKKIFHTLDLR
jgi:hypothetical protein